VVVIESRSGLLHARLKAALAGANEDERHSSANQHQLDMPTRKQAARQGSQGK
jgi:hypothetical protein